MIPSLSPHTVTAAFLVGSMSAALLRAARGLWAGQGGVSADALGKCRGGACACDGGGLACFRRSEDCVQTAFLPPLNLSSVNAILPSPWWKFSL